MECPDWMTSFGRSLLDMALQTEVAEAFGWYKEGCKRYTGQFPTRVVNSLGCMVAGLRLVEKLCASFNHSWDYFFPLLLEACFGQLAYSVREYLLDGGNHNKSIVEQTFEVMARMNLKAGADFIFDAAGKHLCIWLSHVYDRYTRYRKDYAILGEMLPYEQFHRQLEHTEYFIAKSKTMRFGDKLRRVWVLNFEKLSQFADGSGFLDVGLADAV
jgi:hypothetical protein